MAKLSARGRTELARVEKTVYPTPPDLVTERRYTTAYMSDGTLLQKCDVIFRSDGKRHSYGWIVRGKVDPGLTVEQWLELRARLGYKQVPTRRK